MVRKLLTLLFCTALITASFSSSTVEAASWIEKVDPWLLEQGQALTSGDSIEFLVVLNQQAHLSGLDPSWTKLEKGTFVYETLLETAHATQGPLLDELNGLGAETRSFWITNMIWARGSWQAVQAVASRADVKMVYGNPKVQINLPEQDPLASENVSPDAIEWNILKVNADDVWALGYEGQGVVIGGQDTGYQWDHPALKNQYRGWDGSAADHNYNWHDAIHEDNSWCDGDSPFPCDDYGHGTHTMGTMVGDDGGSNQIGMAPGAEWIGCRNMDNGDGTPASYMECFEWFVAPYPLGGTPDDGDPAMAPDVISNSWGCPESEGCNADTLLQVVQNVREAGIMVVASAGNEGSSCGTVSSPPGIYDETFSVGATDSSDNIASFSSRGPASWNGNVYLKPDISAPGSGVRSAIPTNGYGNMSGTSMAAPHVAGLVGLILSANPSLAGQIDQLEQIIQDTAVPRTTTQDCGGVSGDDVPNNTYGWGRIDALAAVQSVLEAPVADFNAPSTAFAGEPVQFEDTSTGSGTLEYFWDFGDGGTSTDKDPVHTYDTPGFLSITHVVTNDLGSDSVTGSIEIVSLVALESISLTLETTDPILPGIDLSFSASFNPVDLTLPITYTLDFGDGGQPITTTVNVREVDFSHVYDAPGQYTVTLSAWNYGMDPVDAVSVMLDIEVLDVGFDFWLYLPAILTADS